MARCDYCGREVDLPFRCRYCGGLYCAEHRLPEAHGCTGLYRGPRIETETQWVRPPEVRPALFSMRELHHLSLALLLVSLLPLTWLRGLIFRRPLLVLGAIAIFAAAFLLHELGHRFTARSLGYWAEFRLSPMGVLITLLSYPTPLKIVAPGAVYVSGLPPIWDYGRIALAGPAVNIAQALIYLVINQMSVGSLRLLSGLGAMINSSLAAFNLLPLPEFDGSKVLNWSWKNWLLALTASALLYLYTAL